MSGQTNEFFELSRDVSAVIIPAGEERLLRAGTNGFITQSLGGNYTVYVDGNLFRIAAADADALGKEPVSAPVLPDHATGKDVRDVIWRQLKTCFDPEIPINIVDLGLVYRCEITATSDDQWTVEIDMTLTAPGCGMGEILVQDVQNKISAIPSVGNVRVRLVFYPPWNRDMMSEEAMLQTGLM